MIDLFDISIDIFFEDGRIPPNMFIQALRRTRRAKLTFLERLEVFDLYEAQVRCMI